MDIVYSFPLTHLAHNSKPVKHSVWFGGGVKPGQSTQEGGGLIHNDDCVRDDINTTCIWSHCQQWECVGGNKLYVAFYRSKDLNLRSMQFILKLRDIGKK